MNTQEYLKAVLAGQDLAEDSPELAELRQHRKDVDALLRGAFKNCTPSIRYGGSHAKGTLNKESYDLDIACYFNCDDDAAGASLKEIYENTAAALANSYQVERKTSALRLRGRQPHNIGRNFHIDVVPGRFVDDSSADCFLHQEGVDKARLKTNLQVHIDHVRNSGVVSEIRLLKLWKVRRTLALKNFVFELLVIEILKGGKGGDYAAQLTKVWKALKDAPEPIWVEDPANPAGNDFSEILTQQWGELANAAATTLAQIEQFGWEIVFGPAGNGGSGGNGGRVSSLRSAAVSGGATTKPWLPRE